MSKLFDYNDFEDASELEKALEQEAENYTENLENYPLFVYVSYLNHFDDSVTKETITKFDYQSFHPIIEALLKPWNTWMYKDQIGSDVASKLFNSLAKRDEDNNLIIEEDYWRPTYFVLFQYGQDITVPEPHKSLIEAFIPDPTQRANWHSGFFKYELTDKGEKWLRKHSKANEKDAEYFKDRPRGFLGACWLAVNSYYGSWLLQLPFSTLPSEPIFNEKEGNEVGFMWSKTKKEAWERTSQEREFWGTPCHSWALKQEFLLRDEETIGEAILERYSAKFLDWKPTIATCSFNAFCLENGYYPVIYKLSADSKRPGEFVQTSDGPVGKKHLKSQYTLLLFDRFEDHLMVHYTPTSERDGWLIEKGLESKFSILQGLMYMKTHKLIRPLNGYDVYKRTQYRGGFDQMCEVNLDRFIKKGQPEAWQRIITKKKDRYVPKIMGFFDSEASTNEEYHKIYCLSYWFGKSIEDFKVDKGEIKNLWESTKKAVGKAFLDEVVSFALEHGDKEIMKRSFITKDPAMVLFAHNLQYDATFIKPYLKDIKAIEQGGRLYQLTGRINRGKQSIILEFRDTLCLFQTSLRVLGKEYIWGKEAEDVKKEVFPYNWYTFENFDKYSSGWANIEHVKESFAKEPGKYEEFVLNLKKTLLFIPGEAQGYYFYKSDQFEQVINEDSDELVWEQFNYRNYALFYCNQDVRVLGRAYYNLRQLYLGETIEGSSIVGSVPFKVDICEKLTASGIAFGWFQDVCIFSHNRMVDSGFSPSEEETAREISAIKMTSNPKGNKVDFRAMAKERLFAKYREQNKEKYIFECNGPIRYIILSANRGGRCMVRGNGKFHYVAAENGGVKLLDYDGVSLYPSAMNRLWISEGEAKIFRKTEGITLTQADFLNRWLDCDSNDFENKDHKWTDAVIHVIKLNSRRKSYFPVLCLRNEQTKLNEWKNFEDEEVDTWINAIDLQNFIDFQRGEFEWDSAIYWDQRRDIGIRAKIAELFKFRADNKKHPIQKVTKTMMNSISGKTIQKLHKTETVYKNGIKWKHLGDHKFEAENNIRKFMNANAYRVKDIEYCYGDYYKIKLYQRDMGFAMPIFGQDVFAMARRIIQPIFNIAEDLEETHPEMTPSVFYTDTDSLHIREDMLKLVEERYLEIYHKPIAGKNLGEFHIDFDPVQGHEVLGAIESYFIAKKIYVDKLLLDNGEIAHHKRMKGIPNDLLDWQHYVDIFDDKIHVYQLVDENHPSFIFKDGYVKSRRFMERAIMTKEAKKMLLEESRLLKEFSETLKRAAEGELDEPGAKRTRLED